MDPEPRYIFSPEEAEHFVAAQMRDMGFADATVTESGPDGGIDVRARGAVAQVKWTHAKIGRPELQRLYGARGRDHSKDMLFFSESHYTPKALDYANEVGIALFLYTQDQRLFAGNKLAEDFRAGIDRVRAARAAKAVRAALIRQVVWSIALFCSVCGVLVTVIARNSVVVGWLAATVLCVLGLALAVFYRPGAK
jgi:hypothetical protein